MFLTIFQTVYSISGSWLCLQDPILLIPETQVSLHRLLRRVTSPGLSALLEAACVTLTSVALCCSSQCWVYPLS